MARFETAFKDPGPEYRCAPFWSWNDRLTDEELVWQIDQMKSVGMGGFFMHSRAGLITPFMSDEWMDRVKTCVDHGRAVGMRAWLYDEDRWPSGTAGAIVTKANPEYQMRPLVKVNRAAGEPLPDDGDLVAVFLPDEGYARVDGDPADAGDLNRLVFYVPPPQPRTWFNGTAYLDTMNPDAVASFITHGYEPYRKEIGDAFGTTVPGVFTDEPNYLRSPSMSDPTALAFPWTSGLPAFFRKRRGYDLVPHLASLVARTGDWRRVRHDFRQTCTERFVEAYTKQIGRWCGEHGLLFTGHMLAEETLQSQISVIGAAMPHYEHMQAPGVDLLKEQIVETLTLKQCSSVAHQMGRTWVLSELYGVTGWQFTFEGMKWLGDWHAVLGINLRCPHLTLYSLRGCRKRDYPPSFNYQSPWWGDYRILEDHYARVNLAITQGRYAADVLLLHPIASAWCLDGPDDGGAVARLNKTFTSLAETLLGLHRGFDFGDETIMARRARVKGDAISVGRMAYRAVVVPPMPSIEPKTLALLEAFAEAGGTVIAVTPTPTRAAGAPSTDVKAFFNSKAVVRTSRSRAALEKALNRALPKGVAVADAKGREIAPVWVHERSAGKRRIYFLANTDRERAHAATISLPVVGRVEVLNTETGEVTPVPVRATKAGVRFEHTFAPVGSLLVRVDAGKEPVKARRGNRGNRGHNPGIMSPVSPSPVSPSPVSRKHIELTGPFAFGRKGPNALTLDTCRYRIRNGRWSGQVPVWRANEDIIEHFGLVSNRTNDSIQYWRLYPQAKDLGPNARIALRFEFDVASAPAEQIKLVLEAAERFSITLNGRAIDNTPDGWYVDKAFHVVPLGDAVRKGRNVLDLKAVMSQDLELETCYLIGAFAVNRKTRAISAGEPKRLKLGDWCDQGYPYFTGRMTYRASVEVPELNGRRAVLELGAFSAAVVRCCVNGASVGRRGWAPYAFDITDALQPGPNDIEIDVVATNRNLMGPHHWTVTGPGWCGPNAFSDERNWTDDYRLHPYGLLTAPRIVLE